MKLKGFLFMNNRIYGFLLFIALFFVVDLTSWAQLPSGLRLPTGTSGGGTGTGGGGTGGNVVLDDSTKVIYGPSTTHFFFEDDILNNRDSVRFRVDTLMENFHRWSYVDRAWNKLVDLGNLGTATRQLFFQPREEVGAQLGFRAYDPYALQSSDVKYYDTHSPYTDMYYMQGGKGQNILRFGFNQNITPKWNAGFRFQRFTSNKQFGTYSTTSSEQNLASNWNFLFHTNYFSKNKKYLLLAHFRHLNHVVKEQGGVLPDTLNGVYNIYDYDGSARLSNLARSWERRSVFHLYHQYRLANGFQVFHQAEFTTTKNRYSDNNDSVGVLNDIYKNRFFDKDSTRQDIQYRLYDQKIGIKGTFSGFTYRAFLRQRLYSMNTQSQVENTLGKPYTRYNSGLKFDNIVGLWLSYYLKDSTQHLIAEGEHLLGKDFRLKGELSTKWGKAGYQTSFWSPDLLTQTYVSNNLIWYNSDMKLTGANTIYGSIPLKTKYFEFVPEVQYHLISRYVYYDTEAIARQDNGSFSLLRIGTTAKMMAKKFNAQAQGYYTVSSNTSIIRIPSVFAAGQVTFDFLYMKELFVQLGIAASYRSSYLADAYMPVTQQFYLQNNFRVGSYVLADVFANLRIKRVRLVLKLSHANAGIGKPGYFTTPGYLGMNRTFNIGVSWPLFD